MSFDDLGLSEPLLRAIRDQNYTTPTPIQLQAIPPLLDGRDVLGVAQTGTGKTAAFSLPVLQHLHDSQDEGGRRHVRCLILTPTRELATQIGESMRVYGTYLDIEHHVIFGGVSQHSQVQALRRGFDVLVATPGRLLDLINQGHCRLNKVDFLILDEADRMLDMGFIHDLKKILALLPKRRQNLLFSATMPPNIAKLAQDYLHDPVRVEVAPQATTVERIDQSVMFVLQSNKRKLLSHLLDELDVEKAIVFTRTKHGANRLVKSLEIDGHSAAAIHGNKSQNARTRALEGFKKGKVKALVATDVASRGIDIDGVTHVFNYDLPNESESYVHRIGRTGRAGREGIAIAFCDETEGGYLNDIQRLIGMPVPPDMEQPFHYHEAIPNPRETGGPHGGGRGNGGGRGRGGGGRGGPGGGGRPRGPGRGGPRRGPGGGGGGGGGTRKSSGGGGGAGGAGGGAPKRRKPRS